MCNAVEVDASAKITELKTHLPFLSRTPFTVTCAAINPELGIEIKRALACIGIESIFRFILSR